MSKPVACVAKGGCSYLRTLARLELLAGFDRTAHLYEQGAARCKTEGCWAAHQGETATSAAASDRSPVPLKTIAAPVKPSALWQPTGVVDAIPFDRSTLVDRVSDAAGNYVERRELKLEGLTDRTDPLGYIFNYWRQLNAGTECKLSNIDTVHLERSGIIGKLHIVDVSSPDPADFHFELFGYAVPVGQYKTPRAHPVDIWVDSLLRDYNTIRLTGTPRLCRVRTRLADVAYHYTRLLLPFLDSRGDVSSLVVAIRQEPGDGVNLKASR